MMLVDIPSWVKAEGIEHQSATLVHQFLNHVFLFVFFSEEFCEWNFWIFLVKSVFCFVLRESIAESVELLYVVNLDF
jgi:uncharacterized membrane protein (DUF106 family)